MVQPVFDVPMPPNQLEQGSRFARRRVRRKAGQIEVIFDLRGLVFFLQIVAADAQQHNLAQTRPPATLAFAAMAVAACLQVAPQFMGHEHWASRAPLFSSLRARNGCVESCLRASAASATSVS